MLEKYHSFMHATEIFPDIRNSDHILIIGDWNITEVSGTKVISQMVLSSVK